MSDKRTCGNCVECIFISKRKDKEWGSVYDWLCRERGITLVCFAAENEFLACSRHRYYDECFGKADGERDRLLNVQKEQLRTSGIGLDWKELDSKPVDLSGLDPARFPKIDHICDATKKAGE